MTGKVIECNAIRGMIGVRTDAGDYSVIEVSADQVTVGDTVEWTGETPLGRKWLMNTSRGLRFSAFFQRHGVRKDQLKQELLL